jgi:hypothetical protein
MKVNELIVLSDGKFGIVLESKKYGSKLAIIDRVDAKKISGIHWSLQKQITGKYYARSSVFGLLHRFLLGVSDLSIEVDHKNDNGLDCRRSNIRKASHSENRWNRGKQGGNTSGYKGVFLDKKYDRWNALIGVFGKHIYLGRFRLAKEAHRAYLKATRDYHGEFGRGV